MLQGDCCRRSKGVLALLLLALGALLPAEARADPQVVEPQVVDPTDVKVHAFVSQGFIKTTANEYLARSKRGSFDFTEVGINFTTHLSKQLRVGMQLFAQNLGPIGNYTPRFDWYYLDYRFRDWFGLRAGRTKIPFGLYNESADIDAARVPILLPQSVYPSDHREYLLAQTGIEVYGNKRLGPLGEVEYRGYGGTLDMGLRWDPLRRHHRRLQMPYVYGGRLLGSHRSRLTAAVRPSAALPWNSP